MLAWAMGCASVLGVAPAQAQAEGPDEVSAPRPAVEALIQQGIELRRAGKDDEALQIFQEAERQSPQSVRVRVHLAATHQALGHWMEADTYLQGVLSEADDPYVRRHRSTLEKAAEFVGHHIGSIEISGGPDGAEVRLDGRRLGEIPLAAAARVPVGSYQLEVSLSGHYDVRRPVVITDRGVVREAVQLVPIPPRASPSASAVRLETGARPPLDQHETGSPRWLSWTLTGLATGAAVTTGVAFALRERHASRWNSDDCQQVGRLRGDVCPNELAQGRDAERIGYMSGVATLLLGAGAVVSWQLDEDSDSTDTAHSADCRITLAGAVCSGRF
jgi:hypothetical protein